LHASEIDRASSYFFSNNVPAILAPLIGRKPGADVIKANATLRYDSIQE
jgi:hypothetical protein